MSVKDYSYMHRPTCRRLTWISFSRLLTFFIPNFLLHYVGGFNTAASRQAWREKIALFFIYIFSAAFLYFWLEFISSLFCDPEKPYEYAEVFSNDSKMAAINGKAVDWKHTGVDSPMVNWVNQYPHHDLSANFPKFMMLSRTSSNQPFRDSMVNSCIYYQNKGEEADAWLDYVIENNPGYQHNKLDITALTYCPDPDHLNVTGSPCFYSADYQAQLRSLPIKGDVQYDPKVIERTYNSLPSADNTTKQAYVILDGYVLDVTTYLTGATNIIPLSATLSSRAFALDRMFLPLDLTLFLYINLGKDISDYFDGNVTENPALYRNCLIHMFQKGVVPSYISSDCQRINPALWATLGAGLLYFLIKMNLAYLSRVPFVHKLLFHSTPEFSSAALYYQHQRSSASQHSHWPYTILMVPCFSESFEALRQAIDTLSRTTYDDTKKLLLFVCDGVTTSTKEQKETHVLLLEYLGYSCTDEPLSQPYNSLGQNRKRINYARVYSGYYETGRNRVPYVVIVKIGQPHEITDYTSKPNAAPPGNRGKRDSLVMILSFLERCINLGNNLITPLDYEIFNQCYNLLGIDPRCFKYMMVSDADIQVQSDVVQKLVSRLEQDRKMLAVSGHVRPANPEQNLTTMLQIFPIHMAFFSGLAYEACLKSVMTINGGLVMYKIWTDNMLPREHRQQQERDRKVFKKWKLLQQNSSNASSQQSLSNHYPQDQLQLNRWPKLSDEIVITDPFQDPPTRTSTSTNDSTTTITTATTTAAGHHHHQSVHSRSTIEDTREIRTVVRPDSRLSLSARVDIQACCVHPTVLRGISTSQVNTMHMQNVLLLGEEKIMAMVLLRSHPGHRLGFEPDAVGYATLPTNFFALQGLQTRNIRSTFHTQLEMQRVAWHLGFTYWLLSTIEILDMIFSMPIIIYLYGVFGRSVKGAGLAYIIIVCAFTGLIVLHIFFFLLRRQFRYILWFVLYCLLSVPLFVVWFPFLAIWQSNYAEYWYDVWPTSGKRRSRLHGIVDHPYNDRKREAAEKTVTSGYDEEEAEGEEDEQEEEHLSVPRLKLSEYEVAEARRLHQAAEAALDSNFIGFTGFASGEGGDGMPPSAEESETATAHSIVAPPVAQVRHGLHSTRIITTGFDMYNTSSTWRNRYPNSKVDDAYGHESPVQNPFADGNPFDDDYCISKEESTSNKARNRHRPSRSQSSYFTYSSQQNDNSNFTYSTKTGAFLANDDSTLPSSLNSSGFAKIPLYLDHPPDDIMMETITPANPIVDSRYSSEEDQQDRASVLSISSNTFSVYTPADNNDSSTSRLAHHRRLVRYNNDNSSSSDEDEYQLSPPSVTHAVREEGRNRAVHNFTSQPPNASNINLRQQYENHAITAANTNTINNNNTSNVLLKTRRLKKAAILHAPSSSSLSRHYRNASDSTHLIRNQPSRSTLAAGESIAAEVKSEVRSYLQRADLESTTRAQVKAHLTQHFAGRNLEESFVNQCIEEITSELLAGTK